MAPCALNSETIRDRLRAVRERIARAAERGSHAEGPITLVGVSKQKSPELITQAVDAGLRHLGENYVQEVLRKLPEVRERLMQRGLEAPCYHFVGRLQRNKVRDALQFFDVVESVDRASLARALAQRAEAEQRDLAVLLQVDLAGELQKGGIAPDRLPELLETCANLPRLRVIGLMTLPPASEDPEKNRPLFAELRELRNALRDAPGAGRLRELSMGMSADFEVAIEEGATIVRVGSAIFGPREG